jgi:transcriptional regulator GlxA family with amidase domain
MQIAFVLFERFTALDIVGPYQVLAEQPGHNAIWVAEQRGAVMDHTGHLPIMAEASFSEVLTPDIVVVPGGVKVQDHIPGHPVIEWLQQAHPTSTWTTSVCTGSLFLAAAGITTGVDSSCHWASVNHLEALGAHYVEDRVVERGKVMTAAGVSAGIDMALTLTDRLHGPAMAQAIQLAIEYDPQPPFNAGSPRTAPPEIVDLVIAFRGMT